MTPLLLLGLLGLLVVASDDKKKPSSRTPSPEVPIGPDADKYEAVGGELAYRPEIAIPLIQTLLFRYVAPTEQPNVFIVLPGGGQQIGAAQGGAYWGLEHLHDDGYVLWVPLGFHRPEHAATGQFVVALPVGDKPPEGYAALIMPDEPWPPAPKQG